MTGRSPHGERGLKSYEITYPKEIPMSLPTRGAWIEIRQAVIHIKDADVAPHTGSVD